MILSYFNAIFLLIKRTIILKYGGYAHGTKQKLGEISMDELENPLNDKEYAIRSKYGDKCWNKLLQFFDVFAPLYT